MAGAHVGHNSTVGNHVIIANGALLGGHVTVADRVFISGNCLLHQFVRVGTLALMQGGSAISKDLPPYAIASNTDSNCMSGLNTIGLRRAGFTSAQRLEIKQLYHALFRSGGKFRDALATAREKFIQPISVVLLDFAAASKRGLCADIGSHAGTEAEE
jgi:UDP-N-acetylglucosamine acyltransferase